jgi:homocysteine S-methyltransferase
VSTHPFLEILKERPLLFDGAIGTELYRRGVYLTNSFEELNLTRPGLVLSVHRDYLEAGAEVLTTNSYGANRTRLSHFNLGDKVEAINRAAGELAQEAAGRRAWVAGAIGPTGLGTACFLGPAAEEYREVYREQMRALLDGGVDFLLLETFSQLAEAHMVIRVAKDSFPDTPLVATLRFETDQKLGDGSTPEAVADALVDWGADAIGANCGEGPQLVFEVSRRMLGHGVPVICQPNAGSPKSLEGRTIYVANPEFFGVMGRRMLKAGISAVGGCCGTTPEHIRRLRSAVRMMGGAISVPRKDEALATIVELRQDNPVGVDRVPVEERSVFARKMTAGKFVVSVEVNPPISLDPGESLDAAQMLTEAGVDIINIADGPRASVRMSNLAMALLMREKTDAEVLLHVCCRDRNLLGLQSDLLGAHALGIRNVLIITGDPPKVGDYPDATAVYDLDSIGLLHWVRAYNHGLDPTGKPLDEPTHFWVGTGAEPAAMDYEREIRRLEQKVEAGADFVMTQPVYEPQRVERFLNDVEHLGIPILLGLLPLASYRNAEFLNANVPGMDIPEEIRRRMQSVKPGKAARAEGVKIAQESLLNLKDRVQGAYIMPPLGHYEMAPAILEVLGEEWKKWDEPTSAPRT